MPRYFYEYVVLLNDTWEYAVFDRQQGDDEIALCEHRHDAEKIVDALNGVKPRDVGIFG